MHAALTMLELLLALAAPLAAASQRPPNIVQIVGDDIAWDDVSSYGSKDIATPNLDRLAARGMRFTSFYAPHSTCTPTRAALLTGCYAQRVSLPNVLFPNSKTGIAAEEVTLAELVRERGYATACIGKWHLGHLAPFLPTNHGFEHFFGIPYPNDHGPERLDSHGVSRGFPAIPLMRDLAIVEAPAQLASCPERFTAEATAFIDQHKERPFYLHFANIETHTPWLVGRAFQYKSKAGVYGDAVQCFDWSVGRIVDALERNGLLDDTLIVVTSDNGPLVHEYPELERIYGHAATVDTTRAHALREGKYQSRYEGGSRVFCIATWPGHIEAGRVSDALVAGFDWYPTIAKLAGASLPSDRVIDGRDLAPLLFASEPAQPLHESLCFYEGTRLVAVRSARWKLVLREKRPELYDLEHDLDESDDVVAEHPDVVARLEMIVRAARADLGDSATGVVGAAIRPCGRVE